MRVFENIFLELYQIRREIRQRRQGFYVSVCSIAEQTFRRVQHVPLWLDDGAIDYGRRIASPILDVIPAVGARLAVISEDGDPNRSAWIGQVWDDLMPKLTVWIRANLAMEPGRLEVGANGSIHIVVRGEDGADVKGGFTMTPLDDGTITIENENASLTIQPDGTLVFDGAGVKLGKNATQRVALSDKVEARLNALEQYVKNHEHLFVAPAIPASASPTAGKVVGVPDPVSPVTPSNATASTLTTSE